jgi:hypothetical protein
MRNITGLLFQRTMPLCEILFDECLKFFNQARIIVKVITGQTLPGANPMELSGINITA